MICETDNQVARVAGVDNELNQINAIAEINNRFDWIDGVARVINIVNKHKVISFS